VAARRADLVSGTKKMALQGGSAEALPGDVNYMDHARIRPHLQERFCRAFMNFRCGPVPGCPEQYRFSQSNDFLRAFVRAVSTFLNWEQLPPPLPQPRHIRGIFFAAG
jgi:hypothetical protein